MAPRLPGELTETIIDQLQYDPRALGVCSLVCSQWMKRSRHHAFSTVQLRPWRARKFIELSASKTTTIPPYIHRVELNDARVESDHNDTTTEAYFMDTLACLDLPTLRSLKISNVDWTTLPPPRHTEIRRQLSKFQNLQHLEFDNVTFHDFREIANIIKLFPHLNHLSTNVSFMKYREHAIASALPHPLPQTLRHIEVGSDDAIPVVLGWLAANTTPFQKYERDTNHIECLSIRNVRMDHLPHIRNAIRRVGPHLHHLSLGLDHLPWGKEDLSEDELLSNLQLARLGQLRTLTMEGLAIDSCTSFVEDTLPRLLSPLDSSSLHTVVLGFRWPSTQRWHEVDWSHLQRVLMEHHFFGVRNVHVRAYTQGEPGIDDAKDIEGCVRKALSSLDGRGVLRVAVLDGRSLGAYQGGNHSGDTRG
ncbi:cytoplasmic protein [Coprinopsis cinerea AmutBmut pab1-1]|nr:cytoplasmic protein [Coprinopsis cinerea AmutBmut pab1-1]